MTNPREQSVAGPWKAVRSTAQKRRLRDSQRRHQVNVCTLNVRSIATEVRLTGLIEELKTIKFDLVGLSETRRSTIDRYEHDFNPDSPLTIYNCGKNDGNKTYAGVGLAVTKNLDRYTTTVSNISERIIQIAFKFPTGQTMRVTQVYAPCHDDRYEQFLEELRSAISTGRFTHDLIIGDFNARVGNDYPTQSYVGPFCSGQRNERGQAFVDFAESQNWHIGNSFFQKPEGRKWTWRSPNAATRAELDYILVKSRRNLTNVQVLNQFNAGSDHRLVRATLIIGLIHRRPPKPRQLPSDYDEMALKIALLINRPKAQSDHETSGLTKWTAVQTALKNAAKQAERHWKPLPRISDSTKVLLQLRRECKYGLPPPNSQPIARAQALINYAEISKAVRRALEDDLYRHRIQVLERALKQNRLKRGRTELAHKRPVLSQLRRPDGTLTNTTTETTNRAADFYAKLYTSVDGPFTYTHDGPLARPLTGSELRAAATKIRGNTAAGADGIRSKAAKYGIDILADELADAVNSMVCTNNVAPDFAHASTILIPKKGDRTDISNYRPISLLPALYKVVTRALTKRVEEAVSDHLPIEQAGFRRNYSTVDHIHAINQLLEKSHEYNTPVCLLFIDFKKAFDSVEFNAIWTALEHYGVDSSTISIIKSLYSAGTSSISIGQSTAKFDVQRGVRQGDALSPLIFNICLQYAMDQIDWQNDGLNIDGNRLRYLAYADDVTLIAQRPKKLQQMGSKVATECAKIGLQINFKKTEWLASDRKGRFSKSTITIHGQNIKRANSFVYLGQLIQAPRDHGREIGRRIGAAWSAFGKARTLLTDKKVAKHIKRHYFHTCILPTLLYGCETWATTQANLERLARTQRAMERRMLSFRLIDKKPAKWIRKITKLKDVVACARRRKWRFAGKKLGQADDRWTKRLSSWTPTTARPRGRPRTRWEDDLRKCTGVPLASNKRPWIRATRDQKRWSELERTFAKPTEMKTRPTPKTP
jgi:hypothetical protein